MTEPTHTPLRQLRHQAALSIRQLETATGINRGRLSVIERGVPPSADELRRIMAVLGPPQAA